MSIDTLPRVKTYRNHNCGRAHRTFNVFAHCAIKRAAWVAGEGEFALIAWCHVPTITLWPTYAAAVEALDELAACGGRCTRRHEVVRLVLPSNN